MLIAMEPFLYALIAYLIGSIPFGFVVAKLVKGIDIREHGSKNIGATNVGRVCGWGWFLVVILLDGLKGFVPVIGALSLLSMRGSPEEIARATAQASALPMALAAAGALAGHMWPLYLRLKGGKGVATGLGVFLALNPLAVAVATGVWVVIVGISRYVSLGSILAASVLLPAHIFLDAMALKERLPVTVFTALAAALVIFRHKENIKRLRAGTERKIGQKEVLPSDVPRPTSGVGET